MLLIKALEHRSHKCWVLDLALNLKYKKINDLLRANAISIIALKGLTPIPKSRQKVIPKCTRRCHWTTTIFIRSHIILFFGVEYEINRIFSFILWPVNAYNENNFQNFKLRKLVLELTIKSWISVRGEKRKNFLALKAHCAHYEGEKYCALSKCNCQNLPSPCKLAY